MMSLKEVISECEAERKVWRSPELVEHLLPFLDLASTKELAKAHQLTRQTLGRPLNWDKMMKRTFREGVDINDEENDDIREDDPVLASERPKVQLSAQLLLLVEDSDESHLQLNLLHTICRRFPNLDVDEVTKLNCSCKQTHQVSERGFVLVEEALNILGSRKQSVLEVRIFDLLEPLLTALASMVSRQQEMVRELSFWNVGFNKNESAEAFSTLVEQSQAVTSMSLPGLWVCPFILIEGEVGIEGWAATRRAVEHLSATLGREIGVRSERKVMPAARREDLRAIWGNISMWLVLAGPGGVLVGNVLVFDKHEVGEKGGWEGDEGGRKGLNDVTDMSEDEMLQEIAHVEELEEEESSGEEEEEEEGSELSDEGDLGPQ